MASITSVAAGELRAVSGRRTTHWKDSLPALAAAVVIICLVLMVAAPGEETVPYHVGWIVLVVWHGIRPWTPGTAAVVLGGYGVASGAIMVSRASAGVIPVEECAEIPLMCLLVLLMVSHVKRRQDALAELDDVHARERVLARRRERTAQLISHEIRTTLTVAGGYLEIALGRSTDPAIRNDLEVATDEMMRLDRASQRLLRMIGIQEALPMQEVDVDDLMADTMMRWASVAPPRSWVLDAAVGMARCEPAQLRTCLDTLIENSLRHTEENDVVRLVGWVRDGQACLGLADSGLGFPGALAASLNNGSPAPAHGADPTRTGLGLGLVQEVARVHGGRVHVGRSAEGGALVTLVLPAETFVGPRSGDV